MKEATGELNMTVITIVAIAAVVAIFTIFILPSIRNNIRLSSACSASNNGMVTYNDGAGVTCDGNGTCSVEGGATKGCVNETEATRQTGTTRN